MFLNTVRTLYRASSSLSVGNNVVRVSILRLRVRTPVRLELLNESVVLEKWKKFIHERGQVN